MIVFHLSTISTKCIVYKRTGCYILHQNQKHPFLFKSQRKMEHLILESCLLIIARAQPTYTQNFASAPFRTRMKTIVSSGVAKSIMNLLELCMLPDEQNSNGIYPAIKKVIHFKLSAVLKVYCVVSVSVGHFGGPLSTLLLM